MIEVGTSYLRIVGPFYGFFGGGLALYFASQGGSCWLGDDGCRSAGLHRRWRRLDSSISAWRQQRLVFCARRRARCLRVRECGCSCGRCMVQEGERATVNGGSSLIISHLSLPEIKSGCAVTSLFVEKSSLQSIWKFPVLLSREFLRNRLNLRGDRAQKTRRRD